MPSKLTQAVTLLICIWEVPGSNFDQDTRSPACGYFFSTLSLFRVCAVYRAII
jgi:hypothetical protein